MKASSSAPVTPTDSTARTRRKEPLLKFIGVGEDPASRWVVLTFGLLVAANLLSYAAGTTSLSFLEASKFQPWGAVTSIFLYDSWESTLALPILALLWFLLNTRLLRPERRRRSLLLIFGSTNAAVLANILWLFSKSQFVFTMGVSGFEVAAGGIMLVFTVTNLSSLRIRQVPNLIQLRVTDKESMKQLLVFVYVTLAAMLVLTWVTLIDLSGGSVNTEVHVASLIVGIGSAAAYELVSVTKIGVHSAKF